MFVKIHFIFICLYSLHMVQSQSADGQARTLRQLSQINPDGSYNYAFETDNGISAEEQGYQKGDEGQFSIGQYQYTSPEGEVIHLTYQAGADGFLPSGSHLPTPPPVPESVLRTLEYLRANGQL